MEGVTSVFKIFGRNKNSETLLTEVAAAKKSPKKRSAREVVVDRGNALRVEAGFGPTGNAADLGTILLTKLSMDVLQSEGVIVHPDVMDHKDAGFGFAFTCFMAVPVLTALGDKEMEPNKFLASVANAAFQFFDEESRVAIFKLGVRIFQGATKSGASSDKFKEFTDQIHTLVLGYALKESPEVLAALQSRYQAFRRLYGS
jgi:hypothetical protein